MKARIEFTGIKQYAVWSNKFYDQKVISIGFGYRVLIITLPIKGVK